MDDSILNISSGKILISQPFMEDPQFRQSVIVMCEHNSDGSLGFVMNKPLNMKINELVQDFPEQEHDVYFGGPVSTDTIHYVHRLGDLLEDSLEICKGVYWGGDFNKLKFLISTDIVKAHDIRFFVGYSGWSQGQLQEELNGNSWFVGDMDPNYIFKLKSEEIWQDALKNKGNTYTVIAQMNKGFSNN